MDQRTRELVLKAAQEVRAQAEELPDEDPRIGTDLNGACAIASAWLLDQLKELGIEAKVMLWEGGHAYVVVDEHVVDVTATQFPEFRQVPILIMHEREAEAFIYYNPDEAEAFETAVSLQEHQRDTRWPKSQIVRL